MYAHGNTTYQTSFDVFFSVYYKHTFLLVLNDHYVLSSFMFYISSLLKFSVIRMKITLWNEYYMSMILDKK